MATYFTCPHCGQPAETDRTDVAWVDLGVGMGQHLFPALRPGEERHVDQRLACAACYKRFGVRRPPEAFEANPTDPPHPLGTRFHREVRLANPVGRK